MKNNLKSFLVKFITDIIFGLITAIFCYFLIGEIVPQILNTSLMNGAVVVKVDSTILKNIFSIWHNFCILFGIRFVIAYITGNYKFEKEVKDER